VNSALWESRLGEGDGGRIDEVLGDTGFDSDEIRGACLEEHDALPVIPDGSLAPGPHKRRERENPQ
jgi:hypothetical protein